MKEPLPLAKVQDAVLEFLRHRDDAVLFGAQAVNAYVDESRMTQDVDILSTRAEQFAEEIRSHLAKEFSIAVCVRVVADGKGFCIYQVRQPKNRHLVDVRLVHEFPPTQIIADVRVLSPEELIAQKVMSYTHRRSQPKGGTDWRDLAILLLTFPHLKSEHGPVAERLAANGGEADVMQAWQQLVASQIIVPEEDEGY